MSWTDTPIPTSVPKLANALSQQSLDVTKAIAVPAARVEIERYDPTFTVVGVVVILSHRRPLTNSIRVQNTGRVVLLSLPLGKCQQRQA